MDFKNLIIEIGSDRGSALHIFWALVQGAYFRQSQLLSSSFQAISKLKDTSNSSKRFRNGHWLVIVFWAFLLLNLSLFDSGILGRSSYWYPISSKSYELFGEFRIVKQLHSIEFVHFSWLVSFTLGLHIEQQLHCDLKIWVTIQICIALKLHVTSMSWVWKIYIQFVKILHLLWVDQEESFSSSIEQHKIIDISASTVRLKVQCVSWSVQTQSITTIMRNFQSRVGGNAPAGTIICHRIGNFSNLGNIKRNPVSKRPPVSEQTGFWMKFHFSQHSTMNQGEQWQN